MTYRDFQMPSFARSPHSDADWMQWLDEQEVLHDAAPRPRASCAMCGGAVGYFNGQPTPTCYHCHKYGDVLDGIVSITYSLDNGLESMLHKYKDWEGREWLAYPLASLLHVFLNDHLECIEDEFGPIDVFTMAPPNTERGFNRLARLVEVVDEARAGRNWESDLIARRMAVSPPGRGEVKPEAYLVRDPRKVRARTILVLDDTWTSGRTLASVAHALKTAGAGSVVGLTLGRQLNRGSDYGTAPEVLEQVEPRGWSNDCVLCR